MSKPYRIPTLKPLLPMAGRPTARAGADRRIRGTTLQNIRNAHFSERPLCVHCLAKSPPRTTVATELDHVVPLHLGGVESRDPFANRMGLCATCHAEKSASEERARASGGRDER